MTSPTKARIVHLRSSEFFGGPERAILGQCTHMTDYDFTCVSFVRPGQGSDFLEGAAARGIRTLAVPERRAGDFGVLGHLRRFLVEHGVDLVISHDVKANFFGSLVCRDLPVRHIRHFRGATAEDFKMRLYNVIDRFLLRRMPRVIVVSAGTARVVAGMGVRPEVLEVVPNAIEDAKYRSEPRPVAAGTDRPFRFVAAGRLSWEKGCDVLLAAVARLHGVAPPFTVDIYGEGPEEARLRALRAELGLAEVVRLRGFVADILPVLAEADALVLPSRSEGMPNILLEAWAQRLGAVVTAVGGIPEMMEHRVSGLIAAPDDADSLAEQMGAAIGDRALTAACGEGGFAQVRARYSYGSQGVLLDALYSQVLGLPPRDREAQAS